MIDRQGCVIKTLENPHLNGILLGLDITDACLKLREEIFPCCAGQGYLETDHNSRYRCSLRHRLRMIEDVLRQYYRSWGKDFPAPHQLGSNHAARILRHVSDTIKGNRPQGTILTGKRGQPSEIWPMALALTWRFGIPVHIVRPDRSMQNVLPDPDKIQGSFAIFIEQADKLWEEQRAEIVRYLVSFAYNSNALFWIEFCPETLPGASHDQSVKTQLRQLVHKAKSKSPMELLGVKCAARLESLCSSPRVSLDEEFDL